MTNRDKKDSIRGRMADAGESFSVARRKAGAVAGPVSEAELQEIRRTGRCNLANRELTVLPPEIGELTSLRTLGLGGNQVSALPREVTGLLSGVWELGLAGNPLPEPIFELYGQGPHSLAP